MNPSRVAAARRKLERARNCLQSLQTPADGEGEEIWDDFTGLVRSAFSALTAAASGGTQAKWASEMNAERSADPLLQYIYQARNAAEYGNGPIARERLRIVRHHRRMPSNLPFSIRGFTITNGDGSSTEVDVRNSPVVEATPTSPQAQPVTNRNVEYPVPTRHLTDSIETDDTFDLGRHAIVYLERKVLEAEAMVANG